ncbi:MAG: alpha/beta hydrolase [Erysipelotrichaceae bacterium]|nr:alpha/beta hydrolase [Erysipelotrichaceae bacterium]MDD4642566.1 alpha/beta hydrolase [Erysipelotrichaceae bacterium]
MIKEIISIRSNYDQILLYGTLFYDDNSEKALIQIFHGMAEHRHRYEWFAEELVKQGFAVLTCDHRGHGDSAIINGYFADKNGWIVNLEDLEQLQQEALKRIKLPVILFGHSMGTLVARSYLKRYPDKITKMILTGSPSYDPAISFGTILAKLIKLIFSDKHQSKLLDKLSFGSFNKNIKQPQTKFDWLTVNKDNVKDYIEDDKCGFIFTVSGYLDLFWGIKDAYSKDGWRIIDPNLKIAFFSGEEDPCMIDIKKLYLATDHLKSIGYQNVSCELMPKLRHEILNEKNRIEVFTKILAFLNN